MLYFRGIFVRSYIFKTQVNSWKCSLVANVNIFLHNEIIVRNVMNSYIMGQVYWLWGRSNRNFT